MRWPKMAKIAEIIGIHTFLLFQITFDLDVVDTITVSMAVKLKFCQIIHACEGKQQAARFRKIFGS